MQPHRGTMQIHRRPFRIHANPCSAIASRHWILAGPVPDYRQTRWRSPETTTDRTDRSPTPTNRSRSIPPALRVHADPSPNHSGSMQIHARTVARPFRIRPDPCESIPEPCPTDPIHRRIIPDPCSTVADPCTPVADPCSAVADPCNRASPDHFGHSPDPRLAFRESNTEAIAEPRIPVRTSRTRSTIASPSGSVVPVAH